MTSFLDCWARAARALFRQALAGEPELAEGLPKPLEGPAFGFTATLAGDLEGRFSIVVDGAVLDLPLMGEGVDQKAGWAEILREATNAAAAEMLPSAGLRCRVESFEPSGGASQVSRAFQLSGSGRCWAVLVKDEVRAAGQQERETQAAAGAQAPGAAEDRPGSSPSPDARPPGFELLFDVELEATLRFGCREMPLGSILDLGPGDVVQLDRHISDPVDLIVGDKIVARGEAVLVNGNFGLRVTEVAAPRLRLETIRCLF